MTFIGAKFLLSHFRPGLVNGKFLRERNGNHIQAQV